MRNNERGITAVEFTLVLPIAILVIVAALALSLTCVRGIVAQHAAARAARVATVFADDLVDVELHASLPRSLFAGGVSEFSGDRLVSNELPGAITVRAVSTPLLDFADYGMKLTGRESPVTPALPKNLSDAVLRGRDTPSPYCRKEGGYSVCEPE